MEIKITDQKKYYYIRETFLQSLLSDIVTFGMCFLFMYASQYSRFWNTVSIIMFVGFIYGWLTIKKGDKMKEFNSIEDLEKHLEDEKNKRTD